MGQIVVSIQFAHPELGAALEKPGPHIDPWHDQSLEWFLHPGDFLNQSRWQSRQNSVSLDFLA